MSFPNSVITDIIATTIEYRSKTIADNFTAQNALLSYINKSDNVKSVDGGTEIREHFSFAENGNAGSYSGADLLPTAAQDVISGAQFQWSQYAVPVIFTGREASMNSGKEQMMDLVKARVTVAENTLKNLLNRHLYLDGTGNNNKNIVGLASAVPLANTSGVYGAIDRSVTSNAFWRNQKYQATVDAGAVATSATILNQWNNFILTMKRGSDMPNVIIASPTVFATFQGSLQAMQHIYSADAASAGFKAIDYMGIPVVFESLAAGVGANVAYFLNTDYLHLRPHSDRNFVALDSKSAVNQDVTVKTLTWMGQLTCSGSKFQGVYSNT